MSPFRRIWNLFHRRRLDDELAQEVETHLALLEEEERSRGSTSQQAQQRARARFGDPYGHRESALDGIVSRWLENLSKETGFAARRLTRAPAFTLTALVTLALAIAANVSIFAVVERVILNPLPYPDSDRLIELDHGAERLNIRSGFGLTPGLYFHYSERARALESVAIYRTDSATLSGDGRPERIQIARATPTLASVLKAHPALGNWFTDRDAAPGAADVAVVSHRLWSRRYGSDAGLLGRLLVVNGRPAQVIGILPPSFEFLDARAVAFRDAGIDVWLPARIHRTMGFGIWGWSGVARLRDDVTIVDAHHEMTGLLPDLLQAFPGDPYAIGNVQTNLIVFTRTLHEALVGGVARALWTLLAAAGLVVLVACANVANLFLVRSEVRQQEISIRRALGAGRAGIARFFIAESALLSAAGGLVGVALTAGAVRLLVRFGPPTLPRLAEIHLDGVAVTYGAVLSAIAALIFGSVPLWRQSGVASLRNSSRANAPSQARHRTRRVMMAAQVSTALLLLVSAGLMVRSFQRLRTLDPGFNPVSTLTFAIGLPDGEYTSRDEAVAAHQAILDRLAPLPGVTAVSATTCLPVAGGCFGNTVRVRGRELPANTAPPLAMFRAVGNGYFEAMGMRIVQGRGIGRDDVDRQEPVVVIDEVFAEQFFAGQNPLGQHVASNRASAGPGQRQELTWLQVIGVVAPVPVSGLPDRNPVPQLYMPLSIAAGPGIPQSALVGPDISTMSYVVRSSTALPALLGPVRRAVDGVDSNLAVADVRTLQEILDRSSARMAFTMVLLAIAATVALLLGIVGICGTTSYIVTQRTSEIGVRLALGAEPGGVMRMIVWQGGIVAAAGVSVGLGVALLGANLIESLLYGVSPRDPGVFAFMALLLLLIALVACWLPARRAARLSPVDALRIE
jgi:predicted permease